MNPRSMKALAAAALLTAPLIAECGLRNADWPLPGAEFGIWIADSPLPFPSNEAPVIKTQDFSPTTIKTERSIRNPQSAIRNQRMEEFGIASYYAEAFHGKKTANGEKYDMYDLTCAHKSLPFGTLVRVTRLDNGQYITVRVNDRGPYTKGFIIDLSKRAAERMNMLQSGIAKVRIEVVGNTTSKEYSGEPVMYDSGSRPAVAKPAAQPIEVPRTELKKMPASKPAKIADKKVEKVKPVEHSAPEARVFERVTARNFKQFDLYKIEITRPQKAGFGVQVETLHNAENVFATVAKLQSTYENILMSIEPGPGDKPVYKLIVGPYSDKKKADAAQKALKKKGYKGFVVDLKN